MGKVIKAIKAFPSVLLMPAEEGSYNLEHSLRFYKTNIYDMTHADPEGP